LDGGMVVTMNDRRDIFSPGVVVVEGSHLAHVGPAGTWTATADEVVEDCRGLLLAPGLINTHTHAAMALFRGVARDGPRDAWSTTYALPFLERAEPEDLYWGAMLGLLEMLTNGITCIADRGSHMAAIAPAMEQTGIRAVLSHTLWDVDRPLEWDQAQRLLHRWGTDRRRRVHAGIGPHAPNTCSDALLRRCAQLARDVGARVFIHCAQSEAEVAAVRARGYRGSVQCLAANGALGPESVLAHCVYVTDGEIAMLADAGAWVAHCPVSNARIEGRMAPVARMRAAGVRMALATDWAPTNNGMDLFDDMKCAGLLNKVASDSPEFLTAGDLLAMTTIDAAQALGLGEVVGSLAPGKQADLIAIDMDAWHLWPWQEVEMTLVYSVKGLDVRHVWVEGEPVVRDRRPTRVDAGAVREQVARIWFRYRHGRP